MKKYIIAIDGTAASGKGTLARNLAQILGFSYLDTGKLYRYIGYALLRDGENPDEEAAAIRVAKTIQIDLHPEDLQNPALGCDGVGQAASKVAAISGVRTILLEYQRNFARNPPDAAKGVVLDGRDIGTVVCPEADFKLYIDAYIGIRAQRRYKELQSKGISLTYDTVLADMQERDRRDSQRTASPMKPAEDAILLDTGAMSIDDVLEKALLLIKGRLGINPGQ
ncbi:MAG: cytidylate kinase [Alphaproteobacteria bacterium CG_4_9_14_3_um_filter_47_13]|nr:MAG: cytidylate kinase [Alphaproteobacteria bacterium CG_4_9_14_3_um_filter_47_13]